MITGLCTLGCVACASMDLLLGNYERSGIWLIAAGGWFDAWRRERKRERERERRVMLIEESLYRISRGKRFRVGPTNTDQTSGPG